MTFVGPGIVYPLCLATSILCAFLLLRGYKKSGSRLLFWSAIAFAFLALNNLLVVLDMLILQAIDLQLARQAAALSAVAVLLYAFIWEID